MGVSQHGINAEAQQRFDNGLAFFAGRLSARDDSVQWISASIDEIKQHRKKDTEYFAALKACDAIVSTNMK